MYATDFIYDGLSLSEYFFSMICSFDGDGLKTVSAGADIEFNQVSPLGKNEFDIYSAKYSQPYSTKFQICRIPCNEIHTDIYSIAIAEQIKQWLCRKEYHKLKFIHPELQNIYWNATFAVQEIVFGGQCIGFELTMYTDAPYAFYEDDIRTFTCKDNKHTFKFENISTEEQISHPDIRIKFLQDIDNFTLINSMSKKVMILKNCKNREIITINGKQQIISSSLPSHNLGKDFNYMFPEMISSYLFSATPNNFTVNADCEITITHRPAMKIGIGG